MSDVLVLSRVSLLRVARARRSILAIAGWIAFAIASAWLARSLGSENGANHVLRGTFGVFVLPVLCFTIVGASVGSGGLRRAARGASALGASPRAGAWSIAIVSIAMTAVAAAVVGAGMTAVAHGRYDPPLGQDVAAAFWISAIGGAAYASYFVLASAFGSGAMRGVFLAIDWILGSGAGVSSIFVPRGHVQSLLGGALAAELPQRASSVLLLVLAGLYAVAAVFVVRRG